MKAMSDERLGPWRKWGPLAVVLTALAVVVGVLVTTEPIGVTGNGPPSGQAHSDVRRDGHEPLLPEGVLPYPVAVDRGIAEEIEWGPRCDTSTGKLALPLSPARDCMAPYDGPVGATAPGVTGESITVVIYTAMENDPVLQFVYAQVGVTDTSAEQFATYEGFNEILSTYMETYGRRVDLVRYTATGPITDAVAAAADAETIARDIRPFAVLGGPLMTEAFAETLAANGVMCITCTPGQTTEWYEAQGPYVWDVQKNADQYTQMAAEYVGKRLAGRPAEFGGPDVAERTRRFGLIHLSSSPQHEQLRERFQTILRDDYGVELTDVASFPDPVSLAGEAREILSRMKSRGVTSIVYTGDPLAPQTLTENATAQDYFPEWIISGSALVDTTIFARTYDPAQWRHAFGPSNLFARVSPGVAGAAHLYEWFHGEPSPARSVALILPNLQFLYSVLQGVGPELTHEMFRSVVFAAPIIEGNVLNPQLSWGERGLWPGLDYAGVDDQTEVWWDPDAEGEDETGVQGRGMWRYVDGGTRYLPGEWPETPPKVFDPAGAVTIYRELPEGITLPDYEPLR